MSNLVPDDERDLESLGYKQRLDRTLGAWSSFAASYGWVSIYVGISGLFFLGFGAAGPAFFWAYPLIGGIQLLTMLCLAEMSGQVPVAGAMYQWPRHVTNSRFIPWITGWFSIAAILVTLAVTGPTLQQALTTVSSSFQLVGGAADIGTTTTPDGAINALILGGIGITLVTLVNILGVRWMARVTNAIVTIELVAVLVVLVALALNITRGPSVLLETQGTGAGHDWGWIGAFMIGTIAAAYVFYGFENAASLAEETKNPRRNAPRAILRAMVVSIGIGMLLVFLALLAVPNIGAEELSTVGFPYVVQATLGQTLSDVLLLGVALAMLGAATVIQASAVRTIFAMARDGRLPFSAQLGHVSERFQTPVVPTLVTAMIAFSIMFVNYGNPQIFSTLASVTTLLFFVCYLLVIAPMLIARLNGRWPRANHGTHFSLGRWGLPINIAAVVSTIAVIVNVGWPRAAVYGDAHWYLQYGAIVMIGILLLIGVPYYLFAQRGRRDRTLAEHRADASDAAASTQGPYVAQPAPTLTANE